MTSVASVASEASEVSEASEASEASETSESPRTVQTLAFDVAGSTAGESRPDHRTRHVFWLGLGIVFLAAVWIRFLFLEAFSLSPDEGIHLMWVRLIDHGYVPYSQVYITYPPLYPLFLMWSWKIWPSLAGLRWLTFAYTFPAVIFCALIARRVAGDLAGLAAAVFLVLAPQFVNDSRAVLGEMPAVTWSLAAIWLAMVYRDSGRRWPLVLSGLCLACSLLTKVLLPFVVVLVGLMIVSRFLEWDSWPGVRASWRALLRAPWRRILVDLVIWGCALVLPAVVLFLFFDLGPLVQQVVGQRLSARAAYVQETPYWAARIERLGQFVRDNLWLVPLALIGLVETFVYRMRERITLVTWLAFAVAMLMLHEPIRYKHFSIFLPLLVIWAGVAVACLWVWARRFHRRPLWAKVVLGVSLVCLFGYLLRLPVFVQEWQAGLKTAGPPADEQIALEFIQSVTTPRDCLITDDTQLVYWSGRLVPPELAEVSSNRLMAGELTLDELIEISTRYDCQVVAAVSNRIPKYLPDYMEWVKQNYMGRFHYGEDDLFVAKGRSRPDVTHPVRAEFNGRAMLLGYDLETQAVRPGERVPLVLYWQSLSPFDKDYTIFVQLRDENNQTLASADHRPYDGFVPTSAWRPGAVVQDVVWLDVPPALDAGQYRLLVGMYDLETMQRLPVVGDTSGENAIELSGLTLAAP